MEWMLMPLRRYADFSGRSRRKEYWMFVLGCVIVYIALAILSAMVFGGMASGTDMTNPLAVISAFIPVVIFGFIILIPSIAVTVRRFHDQDKTGWLAALAYAPQLLYWLALALGSVVLAGIFSLIGMIGGLIVVVFMFLEGTRGPNRFGPDPKGAIGTDHGQPPSI